MSIIEELFMETATFFDAKTTSPGVKHQTSIKYLPEVLHDKLYAQGI